MSYTDAEIAEAMKHIEANRARQRARLVHNATVGAALRAMTENDGRVALARLCPTCGRLQRECICDGRLP